MNFCVINIEKRTALDKIYSKDSPKYNVDNGPNHVFLDSYGIGSNFDVSSFQDKLKNVSSQENIQAIKYNILHQLNQQINVQIVWKTRSEIQTDGLSFNDITEHVDQKCLKFHFQRKVILSNVLNDFNKSDNKREFLERKIKDYLGNKHNRNLEYKFYKFI